ncbi:MAG: SH3 domain-containing protein [Acidimicrobiia bacterium]
MSGDRVEVVLSGAEASWLMTSHSLTAVPSSPLYAYGDLPPAGGDGGFLESAAVDERFPEALATLCSPDRQVRAIAAGQTDTRIQQFYGSQTVGGDIMVGCWLEGESIRISYPWDAQDLAAAAGTMLMHTPPPESDDFTTSLTASGVRALVAAADAVRSRYLASLAGRDPNVDYQLDEAALVGQLEAGGEGTDARWLVTLMRILAPPFLQMSETPIDVGMGELVAAGLVDAGDGTWAPEPTLMAIAEQWRNPLPAMAHETIEMIAGEVHRYGYRISIRGEGPLRQFDYAGLLEGEVNVTLRSFGSAEYLEELTEFLGSTAPSVPVDPVVTVQEESAPEPVPTLSVLAPVDLFDGEGNVVGGLVPDREYPRLQDAEGWVQSRDDAGNVGWVAAAALADAAAVTSPESVAEVAGSDLPDPAVDADPESEVEAVTGPDRGVESQEPEQISSGEEPEMSAEWVYVMAAVEVRGLRDTSAVAGHLQPGTWYLVERRAGDWAHVSDPDGGLEGWAATAELRSADEPAEAGASETVAVRQPEPEPVPVQQPVQVQPVPVPEPVAQPVWVATHAAPVGGLQAWAQPDPSAPVMADLPAGVELQIVQQRADWAQVRASNGWEGWVDGRRLIAGTSGRAPGGRRDHTGGETAQPVADAGGMTGSGTVATGPSPLPLIAGIALAVTAFLPWVGGGIGSNAFDIPGAFLWSTNSSSTGFNLGILMLLVGAAAVATIFVEQLVPFRKAAALVAIGIAVVFLIQLVRAFAEFSGWGTALGDVFTDGFAVGPWIALGAGVVALVKS